MEPGNNAEVRVFKDLKKQTITARLQLRKTSKTPPPPFLSQYSAKEEVGHCKINIIDASPLIYCTNSFEVKTQEGYMSAIW